jgi:replicative DNA helicase
MLFDELKYLIDKNKNSEYSGIPIKLNKIRNFIPDIQQGTYFLVGGETSSGKTAFTDDFFMLNSIDWILSNETDIDLKIDYFSLEISKTVKLAKAACRKIYIDYGIKTDINYILSRGKNRISDEHYSLVMKTMDYFYNLEKYVSLYDTPVTPNQVWAILMEKIEQNGIIEKGLDKNGKEYIKNYIPKNPNLYHMVIIDHISLLKKNQNLSKKENIDLMSEMLITLRNKFNIIPIVVQQLNRSLSSTDRFKLDRVTPQLSDFKETGNTQEDANVIFALFSPHRYNLPKFYDYDIGILKDRFRSLSILKNRDGQSDLITGLEFTGQVGYFDHLPPAKDINYGNYIL